MSEKTLVEKLGGRKSAAFYACLLSMLVLALVDKAETHILGLIDTLFWSTQALTLRSNPSS